MVPLQLAIKSIKRQKSRSILTMLAIAIGIASVIAISAAGQGIRAMVLGQLDAFGADTLYIEVKVPTDKQSGGPGSVGITITTLKDKDIKSIKQHPNISVAYGAVNGQESVSYNGQIKKIMLMGRGAETLEVEKFNLKEGRFYSIDEENALANVAVLGHQSKQKLFGDEEALGKNIYVVGKPFRVVGVAAQRGSAFFLDMDNVIMLPTKTMQKKILGIDYAQAIMVRLRDVNAADATAEDLRVLLRENHNITDVNRDDFQVNTTADAQKTLTSVTGGLTMLLVAIVCISLLVGGVGIMNIMYVSVAERTFEIGLRKSLGASRRDILWQFLSEAVVITLSGGLVGILFGCLVAVIIYFLATSFGFKWVLDIPLSAIILAVSFSTAIGFVFGLYPARQAAALSPIDAIRRE